MRHEAGLAAVGALAGLLFCFYASFPARIALIAVVAVLFVAGLFILSGKLRRAVSTALLFLLIFSVYGTVWFHFRADNLVALSGETVTVSGVVTDCSDSDTAEVTVSGSIGGIHGKVIVYLSGVSVSSGDRISFSATLSEITDSGTFAAKSYYSAQGIFVRCSDISDISVTKATGIYAIYGKMRDLRDQLTTTFCSYVGLEEGQLLSSMLCGEVDNLDSGVKSSLNRSGIGHLLAVSGIHVSIVAAVVAFLLKLLRAPKAVTFLASEAVMGAFVIFSGMRISAVRAFIMMTVYLFASIVRREYDAEASLGVTILVMLVVAPYSVAQTSFLLSISGVVGLSVVEPAVSKAFGIKGRFQRAVMSAVCSYFCTMPVIVFAFDELSLVSIFTNVLLTPFCTVALVLSLIFAVCGCPAALSVLIEIAGAIAGWVINVCEWISGLGFTYVTIKYATVPLVVVGLTVAVVLVLIFTKSVRKTAFSALGAFATAIAVIFVIGIFDSGTTHLRLTTDGDGYLLTVWQGSECVAIDSDGSYSAVFGYFVREKGLTEVDAVAILENGTANYSAYLNESVAPDYILFDTTASSHSNSETELLKLTDGTVLSLGSASVEVSGDSTSITLGDETIVITSSGIPETGTYFYISDGVCVTNFYGEVMISTVGAEVEIRS